MGVLFGIEQESQHSNCVSFLARRCDSDGMVNHTRQMLMIFGKTVRTDGIINCHTCGKQNIVRTPKPKVFIYHQLWVCHLTKSKLWYWKKRKQTCLPQNAKGWRSKERERERDRNLTTLIGGMCIRRGIG